MDALELLIYENPDFESVLIQSNGLLEYEKTLGLLQLTEQISGRAGTQELFDFLKAHSDQLHAVEEDDFSSHTLRLYQNHDLKSSMQLEINEPARKLLELVQVLIDQARLHAADRSGT